VIRCSADHQHFPELPVVIFSGNVGNETALAQAYNILTMEQNNKSIRQTV